jgi:glutamyl-tRNA synthetase
MTAGIRVRFAPSPTGFLHVGGARTALYNWLFARHAGGTFLLRIEDTDAERSTEASFGAILDGLRWLGLDWDEGPEVGGPAGPYRQAERLSRYRQAAERLLVEGKAYRCYCSPEELELRRKAAMAAGRSPKYDGRCRAAPPRDGVAPAVRLRNDATGQIRVRDLVHGEVAFEASDLDDLIVVRSDEFPTYNFACVVDDAAMGITHVIRGDDHLSNTPRQILIYRALGLPEPIFAHIPMILGADKTRLSKRHGATAITAYRDLGFLPEAMVNYLARLGWSHGDQEIFSREELIRYFTLESVGKVSAVFDVGKLTWLNGQYLKAAPGAGLVAEMRAHWLRAGVPPEALAARDEAWLARVIEVFRERAKTLAELAHSSRFLFMDEIEIEAEAAAKHLTPASRPHLEALLARLDAETRFEPEALEAMYRGLAAARGLKLVELAQPTRVALCGKTVSPPIFPIMALMGKAPVLSRLARAADLCLTAQAS